MKCVRKLSPSTENNSANENHSYVEYAESKKIVL